MSAEKQRIFFREHPRDKSISLEILRSFYGEREFLNLRLSKKYWDKASGTNKPGSNFDPKDAELLIELLQSVIDAYYKKHLGPERQQQRQAQAPAPAPRPSTPYPPREFQESFPHIDESPIRDDDDIPF